MFTDKLAAETAALRLPVINVNASLTVGGLIDAVQQALRLPAASLGTDGATSARAPR